mgnify:CR=1 FL=1|tara:strand:- start:300 stop:1181 length:882 start_codon:yes stop_codon:yes gene_type:complete
MREQLSTITRGFEELRTLRTIVTETVDAVEERVGTLRKAHESLVEGSPASACALGLDSLHFQVRLVSMELASLREMVVAVENHLYYECMYLHKSIQKYAKSEIADKGARERVIVEREFPPYKHLDGDASYDFDVTVRLHSHLVASVQAMADYADEQAAEIENEKGRSKQGLNIESLVHSNAYVHALVTARVHLFSNSLDAFNCHHCKYLRRIGEKARLVLDAITKDVRISTGGAPMPGKGEGAPGSRLTDAQRERKRKKQKRMKQRRKERLEGEGVAGPVESDSGSDAGSPAD